MITYPVKVMLDHHRSLFAVWCDTCRRWGLDGWAHACNVNFYPTIKELITSHQESGPIGPRQSTR